MTDLRFSNLRRLDLTVLLVFLGLMRHGKATRVAAELGLTQSAISHALKRLRDVWDDELFLRRPHGLEPTSVARLLEPSVQAAVEALRTTFDGGRTFDPATAGGLIRLSAFDVEQAALVPGLIAELGAHAPGLRLSVMPYTRLDALTALTDGIIDLAIGYFRDVPPAMIAEPLHEQGYLVVGQPALFNSDGRLTLDRYCALPHVLVSPAGELWGIADRALAALGRNRRVIASVPQFFPALATVARTPCLVTVPEKVALRYASEFGLHSTAPPLALRRFTVSVLRHRRNENDPRLRWIIDACRMISAV
jgi:LysR family transcriptional regulator, mexEF-oprN operon transcriptional activator